MYFKEEIYPYDKWEMFKLKILSHISKKARERSYYIRRDLYYRWKWQRMKYKYCKLDDEQTNRVSKL